MSFVGQTSNRGNRQLQKGTESQYELTPKYDVHNPSNRIFNSDIFDQKTDEEKSLTKKKLRKDRLKEKISLNVKFLLALIIFMAIVYFFFQVYMYLEG